MQVLSSVRFPRLRTLLSGLATLALSLSVWAQSAMVDGEVRKIDEAAAKVTLKHGEISHLHIPAMTMSFRVRDPAWLKNLHVGEKVRFSAEKIDGQYTITAIEPAS
jgi:Cu/Ag efflux protein CusF